MTSLAGPKPVPSSRSGSHGRLAVPIDALSRATAVRGLPCSLDLLLTGAEAWAVVASGAGLPYRATMGDTFDRKCVLRCSALLCSALISHVFHAVSGNTAGLVPQPNTSTVVQPALSFLRSLPIPHCIATRLITPSPLPLPTILPACLLRWSPSLCHKLGAVRP
ncbi:hypothetical protein K431DRAFT_138079 [Polychaeton citri CBS 116435]|uniref:Uncharacterized protein n=1 Tax=Polychaeton citri CBS 116435 TaxID=1314669 RepID=A0A9P4ULX3_9PEZI|nr:hypothetical protein K431DRAFT_138079 [Polychaeton citri CBS 116435]